MNCLDRDDLPQYPAVLQRLPHTILLKTMIAILVLLILSVTSVVRASDYEETPIPAGELQLLPGFYAEKLITVPRDYASWINMTFDPQGRIIASHQGNRICRISLAPLGQRNAKTIVTTLAVNIGNLHGMTYALGSLYCVTSGVFRLRDTDGRGEFGPPELLMKIPGANEHGPHGIVMGPQQDWLYVVAGNTTGMPEQITHDHVSRINPTNRANVPNPNGWVMRISLDGKRRELVCLGLRNAYDLAFNSIGELFTYDSDNEGYHGLPWYRPTNVYHVRLGADFGWRQSPQNLQSYYSDSLPPAVEVGPGSPTGVIFGAETAFPEKYQRAMFACDWSYGRIYAIHFQQSGASYQATAELFASGRPLPSTDIAVGPDGALYFITGGRGMQSHLYRIYWGQAAASIHEHRPEGRQDIPTVFKQRRLLEQHDPIRNEPPLESIWEWLGDDDRAMRYAARSALEGREIQLWGERALSENDIPTKLEALVALARKGDPELASHILRSVRTLRWKLLSVDQRHSALRIAQLVIQRMGIPAEYERSVLVDYFDETYPTPDENLNQEIAKLLYDLSSDRSVVSSITDRTLTVLEQCPNLMQQIHYLRLIARSGIDTFTDAQRQRLAKSVAVDELSAIANRPYAEQGLEFQKMIADLGLERAEDTTPTTRSFVRRWTVNELAELLYDDTLRTGNTDSGKRVFREARCAHCHRIGNSGGVLGPPLDGLAGRFSPQVILESIIRPSAVIADQYRSTSFALVDGKILTGQVVNLGGGAYDVQVDPYHPFGRTKIHVEEVEQTRPSDVSLMPTGILDTFTRKEIQDLLTYLLRSGDLSVNGSPKEH